MKRTDLLVAKLKAKQMVRSAVLVHKQNFAPPAPPPQAQQQQEGQNAPNTQQTTPPDQPV